MSASERLREGLASLDPAIQDRIEAARKVARQEGLPVFLAGGLVRDLLLGRRTGDLDLVVEGDGLRFAAAFAAEVGGRLRRHPRFLTAEIELGDGSVLDVATARAEIYPAPAALPEVRPASLEEDLARRDFSVNAMALSLADDEPRLVDPLGGLEDLERASLRVLHDRSFLDDPTRAFRGARFEKRLGFAMEPKTLALLGEALAAGALDRLSGSRLRAELALVAGEVGIEERVLRRLGEVGLLAGIHPALGWNEKRERSVASALAAARELDLQALDGQALAAPAWSRWRLLLLALVAGLGREAREAVASRLGLVGEERRLVVEGPERVAEAGSRLTGPAVLPHAVAAALDGLAGEELLLLASEGGTALSWIERYLREMRPLAVKLRAADLLARGVAAGPALGRALKAVRDARLDGAIDEAGELDFALEFLRAAEDG